MLSATLNRQPHDFTLTISSLLDESFFPSTNGASQEDKTALKEMVTRWQRYVDEGKFRLSTSLDLKMGEKGGELADCELWAFDGPRAGADRIFEQSGLPLIPSRTYPPRHPSFLPTCRSLAWSSSRVISTM